MRLAARLPAIALLLPLCGCDRTTESVDGLVDRSTAIYVARQRDDGYVIAEIVRESLNCSGGPRVGDLALSRAYIIKKPHPSTPELVIFVRADESTKNFAQVECPVKDGRLVGSGTTLDELRRRAGLRP